MIELESVKRMESLKQSIETVTGESYEDLTGAVKGAVDKAKMEDIWYQFSGKWTQMPRFSNTDIEVFPRINFEKMQYITMQNMVNIKRIDYYINCGKVLNLSDCFKGCTSLEYIKGIDVSNTNALTGIFKDCGKLKTIEEPLYFKSANGLINPFNYCESLEDVLFVPNHIKHSFTIAQSPKLSEKSKQSIVDALMYVETAQTLSVSKQVVFTEEQKATIAEKGFTIAYY
jgi:hypothetical protein